MKSDADIQSERTAMEPIVGPTFAEWYAEACRLEYDTDPNVLLWACRTREVLRRLSIDLGAVSAAADQLINACSRLEECGGDRIRTAMDEVEKTMWWKDGVK